MKKLIIPISDAEAERLAVGKVSFAWVVWLINYIRENYKEVLV